ncbi:MAG: ABC transporter permease [Campylobacterales bacterium]
MRLIVGKSAYLLLLLIFISLLSFAAIKLAPNAMSGGGELNPAMTPEALAHMRQVYGLNRPLVEQYLAWISSLAQLDFGVSYVSGRPVSEEIFDRIGITLLLNGISMALIFVIALKLGISSALKHDRTYDRLVVNLSLASFAMPGFYLALLLLLLFSLWLPLFPSGGIASFGAPEEGVGRWVDLLWHLALPVIVLTFTGFGSLLLYVRALTLEILKSDYIFFARARGLSEAMIKRYYILPNLMPSLITMMGLSFPGLFGGSVILEAIFSIEGMGQLFYQSTLSRDYPVILGIVMIGALMTLVGNMAADLLLLKLNPYARKS